METLKAPFSPTSILYDEDAGTKPFVCPVFLDENTPDVFSVERCGVVIGDKFKNLSPTAQVICIITSFFNYAATQQIIDLTTAFDSLDLQCDVDKIVSETILDYLHRRKLVQWYDKKIEVDMLSDYDNYVSDDIYICDDIIDELRDIDNHHISNLLYTRKSFECYGYSYAYQELSKIICTDTSDITFIDFPFTAVVQGKFMNI